MVLNFYMVHFYFMDMDTDTGSDIDMNVGSPSKYEESEHTDTDVDTEAWRLDFNVLLIHGLQNPLFIVLHSKGSL